MGSTFTALNKPINKPLSTITHRGAGNTLNKNRAVLRLDSSCQSNISAINRKPHRITSNTLRRRLLTIGKIPRLPFVKLKSLQRNIVRIPDTHGLTDEQIGRASCRQSVYEPATSRAHLQQNKIQSHT